MRLVLLDFCNFNCIVLRQNTKMKKNTFRLLGTAFIISVMLLSCTPEQVAELVSNYTINGTVFHGPCTKNTSLNCYETICNNDNIFRMYYSDSAATMGLPDSMKVVSYGYRTTLGYHECCLEVVTSATDTWLSLGGDNATVTTGTAGFTVPDSRVLHFTSGPTTDTGVVSATLLIQ